MLLFILLASGQSIPHEIQGSLVVQSVPLEIVPCVTEGFINSQRNPRKLPGETAGRNLIKKILLDRGCTDKYIGMQDRDVSHLHRDNFERCLQFLESNPDVNAVTMPWREKCSNEPHVKMTALVMRTEWAIKYVWHFCGSTCLCISLKRDLGEAYRYYPMDEKMVEELID